MKITFAEKFIAWLTLFSGLCISAVAVWYSVAGLVSIFAAAALPIMIMGVVLELSKLVATIWLKQNWSVAPRLVKLYLLSAVIILMVITSMGIFGYLSKAHLDQAVPTGTAMAKLSIIDEKIKTERENIETARAALRQLDTAVNEIMSRSRDERGAERSAQLRRQQAPERNRLNGDITRANAAIVKLNEERAPIAADLRAVEAEVGPIKYIAAVIYGDNPETNQLERAVRWVIIIIVIVFDPLAVAMLLASQYSFQNFRERKEKYNKRLSDQLTSAAIDSANKTTNTNVTTESAAPTAAPEVKLANGNYQPYGRIEPTSVFWTATVSDNKVTPTNTPEVNEQPLTKPVDNTPIDNTPVAVNLPEEPQVKKPKREKSRNIAPPGTPGEAWNNAPEEVVAITDLDRVYKEATATEAKRRRTRGWLQSSFPKTDE